MSTILPFNNQTRLSAENARLSWLSQVQKDEAISSGAFELAFVLAGHINRESGFAWPTQETLAKAIRTSERTVRTLLEALAAKGHIAVEHRPGRNTSNRYRLLWKSTADPDVDLSEEYRKPASAFDDGKQETDFRLNVEKPEAGFRISDAKCGNSAQDNRKFCAEKPEAGFRQNLVQEPVLITSSETKVSAKSKIKKSLPPKSSQAEKTPDADLYRRGKEILGKTAGGMITDLKKAKGGDIALARAALETASTKDNPREYIGGIINGGRGRGSPEDLRARGEAW